MNQNSGNFDEHTRQQRENKQKFARIVIFFIFPIVAYISAVIFSYPAAILESVRYGTGSPPEDAGLTPLGVIFGLIIAYWMTRKIYRNLTSDFNPMQE